MTNLRTLMAVAAGGLVLWAVAAPAQAPISNLIVTVGTTIQDTNGNNWSYVLLGSPQGQFLAGKQFAVYARAGYPTNSGAFTLRSTLFQQTNPVAASVLLNESVALGQDLSSLTTALTTLLHNVPGIGSETLGQMVITAFQTAAANPDTASMLALIAHVNPGLTLCAGQGFAEIITGVTTYEVREVNLATGVAGEVLGRVTIVPGSPPVMPAPGFPFQVASNTPSDNLRIKLRWGTSPAFRRLSLLSYGFDVWRIPLAAAVAAGYTNTPPTVGQISSNANFTLANQAPVMATKDFTTGHGTGAADDPADQTTYFFSDRNGYTGLSNSPPAFTDGEQFYYFIAARDVLGRDGKVSPGGPGEAFRRIPPQPPTSLSVQNVYHMQPTNQQALMISWVQNLSATDLVNQYWIYRWPNPMMFLTNDAMPSNNVIGFVNQLTGTNMNSYTDNGTNGPLTPGLTNYWYTVRAVSLAAGGPLLSPHSMPAWGVLRERFGPAAATGQVIGSCGTPAVLFEDFDTVTNTGPPVTNQWQYRFTCQRADPGTAWVEFLITNQYGQGLTLGPIYFPPSGDTVQVDYSPSIEGTNDPATVLCTAGTFYGLESSSTNVTLPSPTSAGRLESVFLAGQVMLTSFSSDNPLAAYVQQYERCLPGNGATAYPDGTVRMSFDTDYPGPVLVQAEVGSDITFIGWVDVGIAYRGQDGFYTVYYPECLLGSLPNFRGCIINLPGDGTCQQHISSGAPNGPINPILISFVLTPRTYEYRLYRSVNAGPLTLIAQSAATFDPSDPFRTIIVTDDTMPPSVSRLCYYVQLLDEHGNGSPMALLGCKDVKPPTLPRPVLAQPQATGDNSNPQVTLNWFCPTSGVYRFQVMVQRADHPGGHVPLGFSGVELTPPLVTYNTSASYLGLLVGNPLSVVQFDAALLSPPTSAGFGPGPQFTTTASVLTNVPYHISVAAMDDEGNAGEPSQVWNFTWKPVNPLPTVPWPARPLPPVNPFDDTSVPGLSAAFQPRVAAVVFLNGNRMLDQTYPVGIRIGDTAPVGSVPYNIGTTDLLSYQVSFGVSIAYIPPPPYNDPNTLIFRRVSSNPSRNGESLLPIAVYRKQVTNPLYPKVTGNVIQVTPLLEQLAYGLSPTTFGDTVTIYDRLIAGGSELLNDKSFGQFLYIRDQQPVMLGASYEYFVARFNDQREISEIIPAGTVTLPLTLGPVP